LAVIAITQKSVAHHCPAAKAAATVRGVRSVGADNVERCHWSGFGGHAAICEQNVGRYSGPRPSPGPDPASQPCG